MNLNFQTQLGARTSQSPSLRPSRGKKKKRKSTRAMVGDWRRTNRASRDEREGREGGKRDWEDTEDAGDRTLFR